MTYYKKYVFTSLFVMLCNIAFAQTRFNKIIDTGHQTMNILVSTTPVDSGYILVIGTGDVEGYGYNRCSMILKTDNMGNVLYRNFVCDSSVDVYEGWYNQNTVLMDNSCLKYVFAKKNKCAYICEFNEELEIINTQSIYYSSDSSLVDAKTAGFYSIDEHLYIPNIIRIDTLDTELYHPILLKVDNNNNLIYNKYMYIGNANHQYTNIIKAFDGNLIAFGDIYASHLWLVSKIDTLGNMIWYRKYGRTNWHNGIYKFISSSPDSCYVMSGVYPVCYANRFHEETSDAACVRKIDEDGNLLWEKVIKNYIVGQGIAFNEKAYDLYVDGEGFIYVVGLGGNCEGYAGILLKLTPNGEIVYRRNYLPTGGHNGWMAYLNSVKPTLDGGLIMGGFTYSEIYGNDFNGYYQQPWLIKTDKDGLDGLCYTELPELEFDVFIPDTVCNMEQINCVVNISGPSAPYTLEFSTGQVIDSIYYPNVFVLKSTGIDVLLASSGMYQYTEYITEATLKDTSENIIARHYNIATPTLPGEQQLAITLTDFYGNTKTIYKDLYVNPCHEVEVDENENIVLSVYPNPASENIIVEGENIAGIEICNLLGEVVYYNSRVVPRRDATNVNVISTENMPSGSYFVRVRMADGKVVTKKIIVL